MSYEAASLARPSRMIRRGGQAGGAGGGPQTEWQGNVQSFPREAGAVDERDTRLEAKSVPL